MNIPLNGSNTAEAYKVDPADMRICQGCGDWFHRDVLHLDPWNDGEWWCADDECWPMRAKEIDEYDGPTDNQLSAAYNSPGIQETYERDADERRRMR